jgi:hypothetical protein
LDTRLRNERIFDLIEKDIELTKKDWDTVAKPKMGNVVKEVFQQTFPEEDVDKAVYIEGRDPILELFLGGFKRGEEKTVRT